MRRRMLLNPNLATTLALHSLTRPWTHLPQLPPVGVSMTLRRSIPISWQTPSLVRRRQRDPSNRRRSPEDHLNSPNCVANRRSQQLGLTSVTGGLLIGDGLFFNRCSQGLLLLLLPLQEREHYDALSQRQKCRQVSRLFHAATSSGDMGSLRGAASVFWFDILACPLPFPFFGRCRCHWLRRLGSGRNGAANNTPRMWTP